MAAAPHHRPPEEDAERIPDSNPYPVEQPQPPTREGIGAATSPRRQHRPEEHLAEGETTPPRELRTDPARGIGEMGTEGVDPSQPLQTGG